MRSMLLLPLVTAALVTSCGGATEEEEQQAIDTALAKIGDCLNIAGYDVNPDRLKDAVIPGVGADNIGIVFSSEQGAEAIRINVNKETGEIQGLNGGDVERLNAAGCRP